MTIGNKPPSPERRAFDAVLVVAFGGPEGLDDIRPFLANVLRGRRVAPARLEAVATHYEHFGGVSPLTAITKKQAEGLRTRLAARGVDLPVYVGMRNWHPLLSDTLERQLKAADLVVLNQCDMVTEDERARVRDWIASVADAVPQFETTQAIVPLAMLTGIALPTPHAHGAGCDHNHAHTDHGSVFDTWSCRPAQVFDAEALRAWLRATPPGLLRLKGVLRTGARAWSELQFGGRHGTLRPATAPADGAALVAIALRGRLPAATLEGFFTP